MSSRVRGWLVALTVACAVGALAGWAGYALVAAREPVVLPTGDRVDAALASLADDPVYVTPDGRSMLSAADEASLEEQISAAPVPVRVIVWQSSKEAGHGYSFDVDEQVADYFAERDGRPGVAVVWQGPDDVDTSAPSGYRTYRLPTLESQGEASLRLGEYVDQLTGTTDTELLVPDTGDQDVSLGVGGGIAAALFFVALPTALVLWALEAFLLRRSGLRGRGRRTPAATGGATTKSSRRIP